MNRIHRVRKTYFIPLILGMFPLYLWNPQLYIMVLATLTLVPVNLYPLVYRSSPWRAGPTGKALFNKACSMALLFDVGLASAWWTYPLEGYLYGLVVTYLCAAITYQFLVMFELKRWGQQHERSGSDPATWHLNEEQR